MSLHKCTGVITQVYRCHYTSVQVSLHKCTGVITQVYRCHYTSVQVSLHKCTGVISQVYTYNPRHSVGPQRRLQTTLKSQYASLQSWNFPLDLSPYFWEAVKTSVCRRNQTISGRGAMGSWYNIRRYMVHGTLSLSLSLSLSLFPYRSIDWCLYELQLCVSLIFHWSGLPHFQRTNS